MEAIPLLENDGFSRHDTLQFDASPEVENMAEEPEQCLIFFVPGNPGLPKFYTHFLATLASMLKESHVSTPRVIRVCAAHLAGFQGSGTPLSVAPYTLQDQIMYTESQLSEFAKELDIPTPRPVRTILIGHSVGAYIVMEMLRRRHANQQPSEPNLEIVEGILLFPTIVDLAKSPLGRILSPLVCMPYAAVLAGSTVWVLGLLLPWILLYNFLKWFLLFPPWAAVAASDFLKSSHGIVQTIYLAREEMKHIKEDQWGEEVWGAEGKASPRLVLFFGKNDSLVGPKIQNNIIKTRSPENDREVPWRPQIFSDKIPHTFCVDEKHSETVSRMVCKWINEIIHPES